MEEKKSYELDKIDIKQLTLERMPMAESLKLIEYFLIIGYEESFIQEKIINKYYSNPNMLKELEEEEKQIKKTSEDTIILNEKQCSHLPTIISAISANDSKSVIPEKTIIKNIFPIPPSIYYTLCENIKNEPYSSNIVFTLIHNDVVNIGYSYIFYESRIIEKVKIYVPKAFVIISQYPFFNTYKRICKELVENQFKNENIQIPIEIQLYNIINFISAPINNQYEITFFLSNDLFDASNCKSDNDFMNLKSQQKYHLNQLSGYRYSEIDMSLILHLLPVDVIIETYIQLLTGRIIAVFSNNLGVLNMILYIFQQFFYPFSDTENVTTLSPIKFYYPDPANSNMVGFLCNFDELEKFDPDNEENMERIELLSEFEVKEDLQQGLFGCEFILDLDKGKLEYVENNSIMEKDPQKKRDEIHKILEYTKKLLTQHKESKEKEYSLFEKSLKNLVQILREISFRLTYQSKNENMINIPDYFTDEMIFTKRIQNAFYQFNLDIAYEFVQEYIGFNGDNSGNINIKIKNKKDTNLKLNEEEDLFFTLFSNNRNSDIILNCIGGYASKEPFIYKTPRIIFENLINFKILNQNIINNKKSDDKVCYENDYLNLIDQIYDKNNEKEITISTFLNFYKFYKEKLTEKIYYLVNNKYVDAKVSKNKKTNNNYRYKYKAIDLDQNLILEYVYILNELTIEEKNKIFNIKNTQKFKIIPSVNLSYNIEHKFLELKNDDYMNIIIACILNILILTISNKTINPFSTIIYQLFRNNNISIRKYTEIILNIALQLFMKEKNKNYYEYEKYFDLYEICMIEKGQLPNDTLKYLKKEIAKYKQLSDKKTEIFDKRYERIKDVKTAKLYEVKSNKKPKDIITVISNANFKDTISCEITFKSKYYKKNKKVTQKELYSPWLIYEETSQLINFYYMNIEKKTIEPPTYVSNIIILIYYVSILAEKNPLLKNVDRFLFLCLDLD